MTKNDFVDAFKGVRGWSDTYKNNFSYEGLRALFEYFEEYEEGTGEIIEFDRVIIACEYSEYSYNEFLEAYGSDFEAVGKSAAWLLGQRIIDFEKLEEHTAVIPIDNTDRIIIQDF